MHCYCVLLQASASEHSYSTSNTCIAHASSKQKKHKRKLNDSGLVLDETQVKSESGIKEDCSGSPNNSVLPNNVNEFCQRKRKKYKK